MTCPSPAAGDRGSVSAELAILLPLMVALLALLAAGFRISQADTRVAGVASAAARSASLERSPAAALNAANSTARAELAAQRIGCGNLQVRVNTDGFLAPPGTAAVVRVDVSCTVRLSDLGLPGDRGHVVRDTAYSPLDPARQRA